VSPSTVFRCLLVGVSYSFNHVQTTVADILGYELSSPSYARVNIQNRTATLDLPGNRALCKAAYPSFRSSAE
jgi:hypothetical protein